MHVLHAEVLKGLCRCLQPAGEVSVQATQRRESDDEDARDQRLRHDGKIDLLQEAERRAKRAACSLRILSLAAAAASPTREVQVVSVPGSVGARRQRDRKDVVRDHKDARVNSHGPDRHNRRDRCGQESDGGREGRVKDADERPLVRIGDDVDQRVGLGRFRVVSAPLPPGVGCLEPCVGEHENVVSADAEHDEDEDAMEDVEVRDLEDETVEHEGHRNREYNLQERHRSDEGAPCSDNEARPDEEDREDNKVHVGLRHALGLQVL
mmetsp:Transcript_72837/g.201968  ORF Transcript_72837/g.201968 Transcript_72837/m.201968 type:complete len:266 (-) Transcript_72837:42-839(-)